MNTRTTAAVLLAACIGYLLAPSPVRSASDDTRRVVEALEKISDRTERIATEIRDAKGARVECSCK